MINVNQKLLIFEHFRIAKTLQIYFRYNNYIVEFLKSYTKKPKHNRYNSMNFEYLYKYKAAIYHLKNTIN